jgi:thiol-disulfide isomerase/thioredoxin
MRGPRRRDAHWKAWALLAALLVPPLAFAQSAAPPAPPAAPVAPAADTTAPRSPVSGMRNKISAGDLLSAESILEVYRERYGEDGRHLVGRSWLARGAWLVGDTAKAARYARETRAECERRLAHGAELEKDADIEIALGAAVEVEAQLLQRTRGAAAATDLIRAELARRPGPVAFRSRLHKRMNLMTLEGAQAPELVIDDWLGARPAPLTERRGTPVVLFLWAEWCGDCRAQAALLSRIRARHAGQVDIVAVTRYYDEPEKRTAEKARVDSVWTADYAAVGDIPRVFSTASMERYGASATPSYVFIDRAGRVNRYTPTRLDEEAFEREVAAILR